VLDDVTSTVAESSATPPLHFVYEADDGRLAFAGPLFTNDDDKEMAPDRMRDWIRRIRPERVGLVGEVFSVSRPTETDLAIRPRDNPRRDHIVAVSLFSRGSQYHESWHAPVLRSESGTLSLGAWEQDLGIQRGFLFDPVAEEMARNRSRWSPFGRSDH
jgi:hypothetical protein